MYALIDCNNFFASCERLFRPELERKPIVVLSSNDGCAVSRSQEAKDLGIPMGAPHFKFRDFFKQNGVLAFSANFGLYGDISERITILLTSITPHLEVYSVDESFLDISELNIDNSQNWGIMVRANILKNIGIPVSIGIAKNKTLAKVANRWAKKHPDTGGVVSLTNTPDQSGPLLGNDQKHTKQYPSLLPSSHLAQETPVLSTVLKGTAVQDIWGVGRKLAPKLKADGVHTAYDLSRLSPQRAQQLLGIHGRQMVAELNGTICLPIQRTSKPQKMITRGRQFGEDTREFHVIEAAVANLTARATAALRREHQLAYQATVTLNTNYHKPGYQQVSKSARFHTPTADTGTIASQLIQLLASNYRNLDYHRADVMLYDFVPEANLQADLLGTVNLSSNELSTRKMSALDTINHRHGKGTIQFAAEMLSKNWQPRTRLISPQYTTNWDELPEATLL